MNMLEIDKFIFASGITMMETSANNINIATAGWTSMGESSIALQVYIDEYLKLQSIMKDYKALILKDINAVRSIGNSINKMDSKISLLWSQGIN